MEVFAIIGTRLAELMQENEVTGKTLANAIGVSGSTVNRWKRSAKLMRLTHILKLADYFNCSLDFLTGRSEKVIDFTPKEYTDFYKNLRQIMQTENISRNKIHRETSIKSSHFVYWEKGSDPHIISLIELADYFDISLDFLVGRER